MSINLLEYFSEHIQKVEFSSKGSNVLIRLLESIIMCKSYFLPEEIIENETWKNKTEIVRENFEKIVERVFEERIFDWFA